MLSRILLGTVLIGFIFFTTTAQAYDLPKIVQNSKTETAPIGSSDWASTELFFRKIKSVLAENENLPAASPERINKDKNLIFIAFYKGSAYFLDKFSLKIKKRNAEKQSWEQHIFPIGSGISPQNSKYTQQKFCLQAGDFFNSLKNNNPISAVENDEDKKFLAECFKVGYYYAFKREIDISGIFDK